MSDETPNLIPHMIRACVLFFCGNLLNNFQNFTRFFKIFISSFLFHFFFSSPESMLDSVLFFFFFIEQHVFLFSFFFFFSNHIVVFPRLSFLQTSTSAKIYTFFFFFFAEPTFITSSLRPLFPILIAALYALQPIG